MKKIVFLLAIFLATNFLSLSASADMGRVSLNQESNNLSIYRTLTKEF